MLVKKCADRNTIKVLALLSCSLFILVPVLGTEVSGDTLNNIEKNMSSSTNDCGLPIDTNVITLDSAWDYLCGPYWDEFSIGSFLNSICTADWVTIFSSISIVSIMNFMSSSNWISSIKSALCDILYEPPVIVTTDPPRENWEWLDRLSGYINDACAWLYDYIDSLLQKGFWEALYTVISDLSSFIWNKLVVPLWNLVFKYIADMGNSIFDFITHSIGIFVIILIVDFFWKVPRISDDITDYTYKRTDILLMKVINFVVNLLGWYEYTII